MLQVIISSLLFFISHCSISSEREIVSHGYRNHRYVVLNPHNLSQSLYLHFVIGRMGGSMTACLNAANERANELFRGEKLGYLGELGKLIS